MRTTSLLALALGAGLCASAPARADWQDLGGSLQSLPECLEVGQAQHCWGLSAGGSLSWWRDGVYTDLLGTIRGAPECVASGQSITCFAPAKLPAAGGPGGLGTITFDGENWGDWSYIGDASLRQKPACASRGSNYTCVALGDDTRSWWVYGSDGGEPRQIPFPLDVTSTLRPMCEAAAGGAHCFTVSRSDGQLWTLVNPDEATQGDWQPILTGTAIGETPHCLASGAKLDCFARTGASGPDALRLISGSFDGRDWGQWVVAPGGGSVQSQPYCNRLRSGFDCYYTSPDMGLRRRQLIRGVWQAEASFAGVARARPECLANPSGQDITCYAQGPRPTLQRLRVQ